MKLAELSVGDRYEATVVQELSRTQIVMYAGASGDYNPLHTDEVYATQVAGYPSVLAHGQLTMGLTAKVITDWIDDGELSGFGVRFRQQVWPGDTLTSTATVAPTVTYVETQPATTYYYPYYYSYGYPYYYPAYGYYPGVSVSLGWGRGWGGWHGGGGFHGGWHR